MYMNEYLYIAPMNVQTIYNIHLLFHIQEKEAGNLLPSRFLDELG